MQEELCASQNDLNIDGKKNGYQIYQSVMNEKGVLFENRIGVGKRIAEIIQGLVLSSYYYVKVQRYLKLHWIR